MILKAQVCKVQVLSIAVSLAGAAFTVTAGSIAVPDTPGEWAQVPEILKRIVPPKFPARDFVITHFGAVAGGRMDCTTAISNAIDACAQAGGGRVIVPAGGFLTGAIHLKSGVNLHLDAGATLEFSTEPRAYLPAVFSRFESVECYNYSPFIYAFGQSNVAVTGPGTLDGQATGENWLAWKGGKGAGARSQKAANERLKKMAADGVPVEQRRFGEGDYLRPNFIQFNRCRNVMVEGVHIRRSPMWEINPVLCTNVIVRGLDIVSHGANNDGCDPESCRDVLIEKCLFDTGDDCIAIKSGRNDDGRRLGVPSVNLIIRDCTMRDGHAGTAIGSEISGSCSNVFVENCEMSSPRLNCALRLKSNAVRGGVLQNIFMRNVKVGQVADCVLQIDFLYEEGTNGIYKPVARNVAMENITVAQTPRVLNVRGFPGAEISGVRIYNSTFKEIAKPDVVQDADVKLVDCMLEPAK
ncbi:MAG: glycoside hydrolase family 28 protein [Limisphaerales bacterium]